MAADSTRDARLEGSWEQMKGRIRESWGALTEDEVEQSRGNWDQLVGSIRERTGESVEAVQTKLNDLLDRVERAGQGSDTGGRAQR